MPGPGTRRPAVPRQLAPPSHPVAGGRAAIVVAFALSQVGKPYRYAAEGPHGYDCSGLVVAAFRRIGVQLPHRSDAMAGHGRPVARSELRVGDLVFPDAGHVAIYIGGGRMVHASTPATGVKVSALYGFRYARRILD